MEWDKVDRLLIAPELSLCQFQFQAVKQKEETEDSHVESLTQGQPASSYQRNDAQGFVLLLFLCKCRTVSYRMQCIKYFGFILDLIS
jgi:hypothetical protein